MIRQLREVAILPANAQTQANEDRAEYDQCDNRDFEIVGAVVQRQTLRGYCNHDAGLVTRERKCRIEEKMRLLMLGPRQAVRLATQDALFRRESA